MISKKLKFTVSSLVIGVIVGGVSAMIFGLILRTKDGIIYSVILISVSEIFFIVRMLTRKKNKDKKEKTN